MDSETKNVKYSSFCFTGIHTFPHVLCTDSRSVPFFV